MAPDDPQYQLQNQLLKPADIAKMLAVKPSWVFAHTRSTATDIIPHLRLGRYLRFVPNDPDFLKWLNRHRDTRTHK